MSSRKAPVQGAERPTPCVGCVKAQTQDVDGGSHSKRCCDQITSKRKALACFQCWEKKKTCLPVDADDPYVKAWLDVIRQGPAADPMDRWEKAYRLNQHLQQGAAAVSRVQQSHFNLIARTAGQLTATADLLEGLFETSLGDLAAYGAYLPPDHPLSAGYDAEQEDELLQEIKKCRTLDDTLTTVADLSSEAVEKVGQVHDLFIAAVRRRGGRGASPEHDGEGERTLSPEMEDGGDH